MKVLGFVACHYGAQFARASLTSIKDHVDKVHIVYSKKTSHGFSTPLVNPDKEHELRQIAEEVLGDKLIWETYDQFPNEIEHRKMRYKYSVGYSLILTIDLDEIFKKDSIGPALKLAYNMPQRFYGVRGYYHFWKSLAHFFIDDDAPIRIENLTRDNLDTGTVQMVVYHLSLAQRREVLEYKMSCFGHKNELKTGWWEKFNTWKPSAINEITHLHPTRDDIWHSPVLYTGKLPECLQNNDFKPRIKMKILLIPLDYQRHAQDPSLFSDMLNAFNRQADARIYSGDNEEIYGWQPDVIHFQGSLTPDQLERLKDGTGAFVSMWTGDARYLPTQSLILYKEVVDAYLLPFSGDTLKVYETLLGKPCRFIWEPIQNWRFKDPQLMDSGKVTFVGNFYDTLPGGEKRRKLLEHLSYKVENLKYYGSVGKINIDYDKVQLEYNESYVVICENNYNDLDEYFTPRNIGALAAGSCAIMRYFPGIEKHFQNNVHCIYYRNEYEALESIDFLKNNPHTRNAIASNGYRLALDNFSMDKWVELYINILKTNFVR